MTDEAKTDAKVAAKVGDAKVDKAKSDEAKAAAKVDEAEAAAKVDGANTDHASAEPTPEAGPPKKRTLKERLKDQLEEYGKVALITYIALSLLTIAGFSIAIAIGVEPSSATGVLGVIGAGWAAAKATMPIRILIVLAITPPIAALVTRRKRKSDEP